MRSTMRGVIVESEPKIKGVIVNSTSITEYTKNMKKAITNPSLVVLKSCCRCILSYHLMELFKKNKNSIEIIEHIMNDIKVEDLVEENEFYNILRVLLITEINKILNMYYATDVNDFQANIEVAADTIVMDIKYIIS